MNLRDLVKPDRCVQLAFRGFVLILVLLLLPAFVARTPFGPFLVLAGACYLAWRIRQAWPERQRRAGGATTSGAERRPVLPGEGVQP